MKYLEKTYKMPSNGLFDGPKKITLREMTTREEKILLGTKDISVFERLVKSCTVEHEGDKGIDFNRLHSADIMYLIFMLRELTYGPEYSQNVTCPHCKTKQDVDIDINEMSVEILSDEDVAKLKEGITVELSTGDKVTIHVMSLGLSNQIDKTIKTRVTQGKIKDVEGFEMIMRLAHTISIEPSAESNLTDDIDFNQIENKVRYLNEIRMRDLRLIRTALNDYKLGIDRSVYRECENCKRDMGVIGYVVPEFFHPTK